jgi:hypothetical protein
MQLIANKPQKIIGSTNLKRTYLLIGNYTDSTVYISKDEYATIDDYTSNAFALKLNGIIELNPCLYQGSFYAYSTTTSDLRVLEL